MSEMQILCSYTKLIPVSKWKESPYQTNTHTDEQIEFLARIIREDAIRKPATISTLSGCGATGHGLVAAIKLNGWTEVPVDYQPFDSEDAERAHVTRDNEIAHWAKTDYARVNAMLGDFSPDFDIDLLGIKDFVLEPAEFGEPKEKADPTLKETQLKKCPNCGVLIEANG